MKFILEINCDNAAFEDNKEAEVARIIRGLAIGLDEGGCFNFLRDHNVNTVGHCEFIEEES